MKAMEISLSGMDVEWRRLEVIAANLANVNTVMTADGTPYRTQQLISGPRRGFSSHMNAASASSLDGVTVYSIESVDTPSRLVYEPGNPQANANGFVAYPDIDHAGQMIMMIKTSRAYEANLVAMNSARQMYSKALELGSRR